MDFRTDWSEGGPIYSCANCEEAGVAVVSGNVVDLAGGPVAAERRHLGLRGGPAVGHPDAPGRR